LTVRHAAIETPRQEAATAASPAYNPETDFLTGTWKVSYETEEFTGAVIYSLKKEGTAFVAYTSRYEDEKGRSQQADNAKTLILESFDGYIGHGIYTMEYEGERYDASCRIDMVDENTFELRYEFQGYGDVETWKRLP
ncbi:MAG: hypothetical protein AAGB22_12505, partial [Bacteroidota bacterium]